MLLACQSFDELNSLFPVNLATDFVCDRFIDEDVLDKVTMDCTALILLGASYLKNLARFMISTE
jgi:hypothetical protein